MGFTGMPASRAKWLSVPRGITPNVEFVRTATDATEDTVPSPPAATSVQPSAAARSAAATISAPRTRRNLASRPSRRTASSSALPLDSAEPDSSLTMIATGAITSRSEFGYRVVGVAIQPAFSRFRRRNHWMLAGTGVLTRVPVRRRIATQRDAATLTGAQVHPPGTHLHAFLAFPSSR